MTVSQRRQIEGIATAIRRGDYSGLRGDGERLVFAAASEMSVSPAELIRLWASGSTKPSARRTRVVVEIDDDRDDNDDDCAPNVSDEDDIDDDDEDDEKEHQDDEDEDDDTNE